MTSSDLQESDLAAAGSSVKRAYVQRIFSEIAPSYDLLNHLLSLNIDRRWRRKALRILEWERDPSGTYLDLCAGTLDVSAALANSPGFRGRIIGADFAEPMLRAGKGKAPRERVHPVVADALSIPMRDASAAGAIVAFGVRNLADLDAGLVEVARVLRPGARLVILEFTPPPSRLRARGSGLSPQRSTLLRSAFEVYFRYALPAIGSLVSRHGTAYRYLPASVQHFPSEEELAARMAAAGFSMIRWLTLSFGIAAIHVGTRT